MTLPLLVWLLSTSVLPQLHPENSCHPQLYNINEQKATALTHTLHFDFLANCSLEFNYVLLKWLWENTAAPLAYDVITGQLLHCWSLIKTKLSSGGYGLSRPRKLTRARGDKQIRLFSWCYLPTAAVRLAKHQLSPRCWAVTGCRSAFKCVLQTRAMRHTGPEWPQKRH